MSRCRVVLCSWYVGCAPLLCHVVPSCCGLLCGVAWLFLSVVVVCALWCYVVSCCVVVSGVVRRSGVWCVLARVFLRCREMLYGCSLCFGVSCSWGSFVSRLVVVCYLAACCVAGILVVCPRWVVWRRVTLCGVVFCRAAVWLLRCVMALRVLWCCFAWCCIRLSVGVLRWVVPCCVMWRRVMPPGVVCCCVALFGCLFWCCVSCWRVCCI